MKRNCLLLTLGVLLSVLAMSGCDVLDPALDGKWDPIQITVNGSRCKASTYRVPAEGGEFSLYSANYGSLWLNEVKENGRTVWSDNYNWQDYRSIHLTTDWYEVQYDHEGKLVVIISPIGATHTPRSLRFEVECGDAFGSITFEQ